MLDRFDLLIPAPAASPMAQLKRPAQPRVRASGNRRKAAAKQGKWTWAEPLPPGAKPPRNDPAES